MSKPPRKFISDSCTIFKCKVCDFHLAKESDLTSDAFQGRSGPANLFSHVYNIIVDPLEHEKVMSTGKHRINDIRCFGCQTKVGWKYLQAFDVSQRYKERKFIIEKAYTTTFDNTAIKLPKYLQNNNLITKLNYYHEIQ